MMTIDAGPQAPQRRAPGRDVLAAGLVLSLIAGAASAAGMAVPLAPVPDEMALGNPRAPVTVTEYASLGCPHCAAWEQQVFPSFKKTYIDTGKVRFVLKEMLFGNSTLAAAGFLTARCAGPDKYFQVVDAIFDQQTQIEEGGVKEMLKVAQAAGLTEDQFKACLQDQAALDRLQARTGRYVTDDKITGTPTFVVGAQRLEGDQTLAQLGTAIDAARHH
jgi:protein-disulfide isomerase